MTKVPKPANPKRRVLVPLGVARELDRRNGQFERKPAHDRLFDALADEAIDEVLSRPARPAKASKPKARHER